jgi:uncharacterized protein (TIGR03437 family)
VEYNGTPSNPATIEIVEAAPAILTLDAPSPRGGRAAALNQDGTINSPDNPAPVGSILTLFATGAGVMQPATPDGQVVATAISDAVLPAYVGFPGASAEILYAGSAPGIVAGVLQVNVRVPDVLCHGYWQCLLDPNFVPVSLGLGQPDPGTYALGRYTSAIFATVSIK